VDRFRWLVVFGALALLAGCSGSEGDAPAGGGDAAAAGTACDQEAAPDTKPAKHLTSCLAPSVVLVEVGGSAAGSGLVVEADDELYVVTNLHVVDPEPEVDLVITAEETERLEAVPVVGIDATADIAVVGPIETEVAPVDLTEPTVEKGDDVFLVGYPGETERDPEVTISGGIVSRLRTDEVFDLSYVQTDASIGGGQSGGALADDVGRVVGVSGLSIADDFALALVGSDVRAAVDRIVAGEGDPYWSFPSDDPANAATAGTISLRGLADVRSLLYDGSAGTTIEFSVDPADSVGVAVTDWDTGENVYADRAAVEALMQQSGMTSDPAALEQLVRDEGLVLGEPVAPGRYRFEVDPDQRVSIDVGQLVETDRELAWTSNVPLAIQLDDQADVPLELGEAQRGVLDYNEVEATFLIDLDDGQAVVVRVSSSAGDPGVVILAPGQAYVDGWSADDSDVGLYGTDVEEDFTAEGAGTYEVIVENYGDASLAFELEITEAE
jgi:S1-C subfamily serine protease